MTAYEDENCDCIKLENDVNKKYPKADWNMDDACKMWNKEKESLKDNNIEFNSGDDECYGCTCPTCGKMICNWCV